MTNQEILDNLSKIESELYYRLDENNDSPKELKTFHEMVNICLLKWHKMTGLTIS